MTYNIIATGSSGNAVLINNSVLIDCGVPFKKLESYVRQLRLVLLTHIHGDHFKASTVRTLHKQRPALRWGCCEWMVTPLLNAGVNKRVIDVFDLNGMDYFYGENTGIDSVQPVQLPHNVPNCGYKIGRDGESLFYATDCATLDGIEAKDYTYYLIESNHTLAEIEARIAAKRAAGEYAYEMEAARNHLSQEQALDWLAVNAGPNSQYVFLHQHQERKQ